MNIETIDKNINQAIASAIEQLKNDMQYRKYTELLEQSIANNDIDAFLTLQITLHSIELGATYRAGHRDCLQYLTHIEAIKSEQT